MASSRNSPGPHDRKPNSDGTPSQRPTCQYFSANSGRKCRFPVGKGGKICNRHKALLEQKALDPGNPSLATPSPGPSGAKLGAIHRDVNATARRAQTRLSSLQRERALQRAEEAERLPSDKAHRTSTGAFLINSQAREALSKLGVTLDPNASGPRVDPKQVLLDSVNSAWRQRQVWEAMLNSIPPTDWEHLGTPPIPGTNAWSKGARIEAIQKHLAEATKVAARTSKLAIDAGIEERLVRLAEEQSALIADTVRVALVAGIAALVQSGLLSHASEPAALDQALASAAARLRLVANTAATAQTPGMGEVIEGIAREMGESA